MRPMTTTTTDDLVEQGARLTYVMDANRAAEHQAARERARVWHEAKARGVRVAVLARAAGVHHTQVLKALRRFPA